MIDPAHLGGFIIDSIFVLIAIAIYYVSRNSVALCALVVYLTVLIFAYGGLELVNYNSIFNVDYHFLMAGLVLAFLIFTVRKPSYWVLKLALCLNFLIHAVMIVKEPAQQMYLISSNAYTVIYNSYENARIIVVSLQLMGLINGIKYGGNNDTNNRLRSRIWRTFNDLRVHTIRLLRVKRL